jgi:hypothetical protein
MSELDLAQVTCVAREAAGKLSPALEVVGVLSVRAGSTYVEILVNITARGHEPCQLVIGVFRNASEKEIARQISAYLDDT